MNSRALVGIVCAAVVVACWLGLGSSEAARQPRGAPNVQHILEEIRKADKGQLAVSEEDGRFLRVMIASSGAKRALEIGGASGYSAIWIGWDCARPAGGW